MPAPVWNNLADSGAGSLRQAIADANAGDTITYSGRVLPSGTINLQSGITITKSITITSQSWITVTNAAGVKLGITLLVGNILGPSVTCEIDELNIQNTSGLGIYTYSSANLTLAYCQISYCTDGGILNGGTLGMTFCEVSWNQKVGGSGGGIGNAGTLNCVGCDIEDNSATNGGGVFNGNDSEANFGGCFVGWNTATNDGGGIYNNNGTLSVYGTNDSRQHIGFATHSLKTAD